MAVNITDYAARLETPNSIFHITPDDRNWSIKRLIFGPAFSVLKLLSRLIDHNNSGWKVALVTRVWPKKTAGRKDWNLFICHLLMVTAARMAISDK